MSAAQVKPMPLIGRSYHMYIALCDEPGHRAPDGILEAWECGVMNPASHENPPLVRADECMNSSPIPTYHFQGEAANVLTMDPGSGIPIGGPKDPKFLVTSFHFFSREETLNGNIGVSGFDVTIRNESSSSSVVPWYSFDFQAFGYLAPHAVGSTTGSMTLRHHHSIQVHVLYPHWHAMATDFMVWIKRSDKGEDLILHLDSESWGLAKLPASEATIMHPGDKLVISCIFNNTMDEVVRVK